MTRFGALSCRRPPCCCLPPIHPSTTQVSLLHRREVMRKDSRVLLGLHELLTYGLKGVAAYAHHAEMLGKVDPQLDDMFEEVRGGGRWRSWFQGGCGHNML